jgi:parallel beta-helix repeat protein
MAALIVLLILCSIMVSLQSINVVKGEPRTIVVPDDYPTIQAAINNAYEGDTVFVKKGTYEFPINQTLVISKTISFMGEDAENTIINLHPPIIQTGWHLVTPQYGYDHPIKIEANGVHFSGFTITRVGGSMRVSGVGTHITGNHIETGLFLEYARQNITGNIVKGGITCIGNNHTIANNILDYVWVMASEVLIEGNTISDYTGAGIAIGGYRNTVFNNNVENCKTGIAFWGYASNNIIYHNNFINNTVQVTMSDPYNPSVGKFDNGYALGGNYWSDYLLKYPNAMEIGNSGIGDSHYVIDPNNQDNYPLMKPVEIAVIPEFPSLIILPLSVMAMLFAVIIKKRVLSPRIKH